MTTSGGTPTSCSGWRVFSRICDSLRRLGGDILSLLYPPECVLCGRNQPAVVCDTCRAGLPRIEGPRCEQCADTLDDPSLDLCIACGTQERSFDRVVAVAPYDRGWRTLIHCFKFDGEQAVGRFLAREAAAVAQSAGLETEIDVITYVPMTRQERRCRGFNQAERLAQGIARELKLPVQRMLAKHRRTERQSRLGARQRRENLRDAFRVVRWERRRVLLVDDICTTGATVNECARALRRGGCHSVVVLTIARA